MAKMFKAVFLCVAATATLASVAQADKTQTFDSAASAAAGGRVATGNGLDGQLAGLH